ncbi:hypothetical protein [Aliiroseovarius sp.]|uniref:hypothetical protein n=1 Tax=Aliiroseovarius sp. TaxID=1872442 RepID=UPI00261A123E|nr:hypothetical protein [Aliiroseovarius sp.]
MSGGREPLFLARQTYRRRRVADAARLLPLLGVLLFMLPLLGAAGAGNGGEGTGSTSIGGIYIFAVWGGLILAAALLSGPLSAGNPAPSGNDGETPETTRTRDTEGRG